MNKELYTNFVQKVILVNSIEIGGLWEAVSEIESHFHVSRQEALNKIKDEIPFINESEEIFLVKSLKLYESSTSEVLDKKELLMLTLEDVEFKEQGSFYYFSSFPGI